MENVHVSVTDRLLMRTPTQDQFVECWNCDYQEWSSEDFSKDPGGKDLSKMKTAQTQLTDNIGCTVSF